jgi:hypothetical protein
LERCADRGRRAILSKLIPDPGFRIGGARDTI